MDICSPILSLGIVLKIQEVLATEFLLATIREDPLIIGLQQASADNGTYDAAKAFGKWCFSF